MTCISRSSHCYRFFFFYCCFFISETILTLHYHRSSNNLYVKLIAPFFFSRWKLWWRVSSGHLKTVWQGWAGSIIKLSKPSEKKSVKDVEFKIFILNEIIKGNPFQNDLIVCRRIYSEVNCVLKKRTFETIEPAPVVNNRHWSFR